MADLTNFNIGQGESFKIQVDVVIDSGSLPLDLTDWQFSGMVRENYSTDLVAANFTIDKLLPYTSGSIFIQLPAASTIDLTSRKYVYDINMTSGSISPTTRRILEGQITIRPAATR